MSANTARLRPIPPDEPWPPEPDPWPVPARLAVFLHQAVPSSMVAGQEYDVSVAMQNTGSEPWTPEGLYRLGAQNPQDNSSWGPARVDLPGPVTPGEVGVFTFRVTAPSQPGVHHFQWRMLQEWVEWFGDFTPSVAVEVRPRPRVAQFVAQSVPPAMVAGRAYDVSVTVRNTGSETWTANELYRLGAQNPHDNVTWGVSRVDVPASIAPGQEALFAFRVTAPATPGTHNFQWRMLQEGVEWFGDLTPNVGVEVRPVPDPLRWLDPAVDDCGSLPPVVSGSVELGQPSQTTVEAGQVNYHVTEQRYRVVNDTIEYAYLQDIAALGIWPGQVLQGRGLLTGDIAPVGPFKRMPGTINLVTDFVGGAPGPQSKLIESPSGEAVDAARRTLLQALNPSDAPGMLKANFQRASTMREVGLKLGLSVKGSAFDVDANATLDRTYKQTTVVAAIRQVFYSVTFAPHGARASGIWSEPDLRQEDLASYVTAGNPPLCVDSVQYGRFICVAVQGAFSSEEITAALKAHWTASVSGSGSVDLRTKEIFDNSEVKIYTIGVPGHRNFQNLQDPIGELQQVYRSGLSFSLENPGAPISFTCRHIADGTLAHVGLSADYVQPLAVRGEDVHGATFPMWDGPGGGLVDTGISANPGDEVTISASGQIWSGVIFSGKHGPRGWAGHKADAAAPLPSGTAYCLIANFGGDRAKWFEVGPFWQGSPQAGSHGRLLLNINDNNPENGDPRDQWTVTVDVVRAGAAAVGIYI